MEEKQYCPRAIEVGGGPDSPFKPPMNGEMTWRSDNSCSYCGSLNPDTLMERLESGTVKICPTDKNYKIYVHNDGGDLFKQSYRTDSKPFKGWDSKEHDWVTRDTEETKFYFQHLSSAQRTRFIELLNEGKIKFLEPGHFYVTPFFMKRIAT